ncbi:Uncharacterised protein [Salmonella enterica subsp. enterica serovar Typhi]|nr:Uncharacterised protein [Salmonella enterica subsp. enterica serovar Typhi]CGC10092.1 Uncharacterised protein [Salmonella enterica subsp. enterica serovar Typhi]CGI80093.1 Uncharacterised protein [Salmonella enterica subsp. enterica serovar Typhi]CGU44359.1 Uncharacterised protein [Salmonella enterica subsp. enterica serovar Typhi]CGV12187.1 Uncharacterised protein [Salmonella enterica subsp. enterica serovar Typhi]
MVGNLRVPSITAVSFVVCRESFIGYSFARSRRGGGGGGGVFTPCVCCNGIFSGNRESNFFDIFLLYVPAFHTKVKFALLSENLKRTDRVL